MPIPVQLACCALNLVMQVEVAVSAERPVGRFVVFFPELPFHQSNFLAEESYSSLPPPLNALLYFFGWYIRCARVE